MTDLLRELIEYIKTASPFVWETLLRQVTVFAYGDIIWGLILLLVAAPLCYVGARRATKKIDGDSDFVPLAIFAWIGTVGFVSWAAFLLTNGILFLSNPSYYAITNIIRLLSRGQ